MFKTGPKPESRNNRLVYLSLQRAWQSPFHGAQLPGNRTGNVCSAQYREAASIPAPAWAQLSLLAVLTLERGAWCAF